MVSSGRIAALAGGFLLLAGCASKPAPAPAPAPPAIETPREPVAPSPPAPAAADWRDLPLSPGDWDYSDQSGYSEARFGPPGVARFRLRCDKAGRRLALALGEGAAAGAITVRTTSEARTFASSSATLAPSDSLLDAIAFSRGRFTVEQAGRPTIVLPAWPETARVTEDCRA
jgi:hypothetical protein